MSHDDHGQRDSHGPAPDSPEPPWHSPEPPRRDKRLYYALMGTCVVLIIVAWQVVRYFSVLAAIIMSAVALIIPPVAVIIANRASAVDRHRPPPFQHH